MLVYLSYTFDKQIKLCLQLSLVRSVVGFHHCRQVALHNCICMFAKLIDLWADNKKRAPSTRTRAGRFTCAYIFVYTLFVQCAGS